MMPTWTKEQNDAILKDKSNIIVSAGAGSGKTAVLSERVIRKLKEGVHINELLLLTFTNAAAKEMKERIRKKIKKEGLTKELEMIDQAYITTFDSYALSIVKKYNYKLNVSKDLSIVDSDLINYEKEKILDTLFEELLNEFDSTYENSRVVKSLSKTSNGFSSYSKLLTKDQMDKLEELVDKKIDNARDMILDADFEIDPKVMKFKNISCEYCKFKDICYMNQNNIKYLKEITDLNFLGGDEDANMD